MSNQLQLNRLLGMCYLHFSNGVRNSRGDKARQITEIEFVHTVGLGVIIFCFQVTIPQYQLHIINRHSKQTKPEFTLPGLKRVE